MSLPSFRILLSLNPRRGTVSSSIPGALNEAHIPTSLFEHLPSHGTQVTAHGSPKLSRFTWARNKDYRFGNLRIDWIDFGNKTEMASMKAFLTGKDKEGQARGKSKVRCVSCT
jgi:BRCA1-associated protein